MRAKQRVVIRYSEAFKQEVISEIERGVLSIEQARRRYGIKGADTIQGWIKRMGKLEFLPKVMRVEKPNEKDRIKELERQVKELKNALADTQVRYLLTESQLEIICEQQGLDVEQVKKKLLAKDSSKRRTKE